MANTTILREFLVSLGFKVDEKGLKNFTSTVEGATKGVARLVTAISGAALTVGVGAAALASKLENLYFVSKRVGASSNNLRALQFAARDFGVSAESAVGTVERLAAFMRNNPAGESYIATLGVKTRDANGNLRDTAELVADIGAELANRPQWMSKQYGDILGIDENFLLAMRDPAFLDRLRQFQEAAKNSGMDKAAQDAHLFMQRMRDLETRIEAVTVKIGNALFNALGPQMEQAASWFDENADSIAASLSGIGETIIGISSIVGPILKTIADGWKNIFDWVKAAGRAIAEVLPESWRGKIGAGTGWLLDKLGIKGAVDKMLGVEGGSGTAAAGTKPDPLAFFQKMGWTREQAAGIVANLRAESQLNPGAVGDNGKAYGIAQWHPDRQAAFAKWAGKDIRGSSLMDQLAFVQHELTQGAEARAGALLRAAKNAQQAGEIVSRYYERPKAADAEAAKRGQAAMALHNDVKIFVNGSDPVATGQAVGREQDRVYNNVIRNMQGASG